MGDRMEYDYTWITWYVPHSLKLIAVIGFILVFGHNLLDYVVLPKEGAGYILMSIFFNARFTTHVSNRA